MLDILVPLDGSALAERVLPVAATLARATGGRVRLVEAIGLPASDGIVPVMDEVHAEVSDYLKAVAAQYELDGRMTAGFGPAPILILQEAAVGGVRYIAMSTHARHGIARAVLGSVAEHVLRESPVPVYLLPAAAEARDFTAIRRIVIPLDGSRLSEAVVEPAGVLALQLGAAVTLVRVYGPPRGRFDGGDGTTRTVDQEVDRIMFRAERYMAPFVRKLESLGVAANRTADIGNDPASQILHLAKRMEADLIVMATHGRSGLDRLRHGSVTEQVLRHSHIPLLAFGRIPLHDLVPAEARTSTLERVAGALAVRSQAPAMA
ncbi:MAG TPA: universal stress protein [Chloroflexota bacterium]|nr:universal stress protein [Chloroflexota bacterium]